MRAQFYLDIVTRLKTIVDNQENPVIQHFDLFNEQVFNEATGQIFKMPAVFIEFQPIAWTQLGENRQSANVLFSLHIASETKALSSDNSPNQSTALQHLQLIGFIHKCLQGHTKNYFSSITRIGSVHNHNHNNIIVHTENYRTRLVDDTAMGTRQAFEPETLHITKTLKNTID